ncbi:MAG: glycosyltransferase family 2 protein [Colwellia sp.]|nr:glycosyltransferase family 2 protein [Colwellia sp.]
MKVTIGIPFYNPGILFKDSVLSILNQTYTDFELILLDDGSTDDSLSIALSFNDKRIKVISDGSNKGLPCRLNQLINLSQGEYIARMDADDLALPERIEQQVKLLDKTLDVDIIATGICSITDNHQVIGYRQPITNKRNTLSITDAIFGRADIAHATILVRKCWYKRNNYNENAKLMEDYQLWIDAAIKKDLNVAYIKTPLYFYREESSVTVRKAIKAYLNVFKIVLVNYFSYLSFYDKIKITTLTFAKICFVSIANLLLLSNKLLLLRNKNTEQNQELLTELQQKLDSLILKFQHN